MVWVWIGLGHIASVAILTWSGWKNPETLWRLDHTMDRPCANLRSEPTSGGGDTP